MSEARLISIVERLDVKLKKTLIENKELRQRVELAQLDQQLAEENAAQATAQLAQLMQRNAELEELYELGTELEQSFANEKRTLESEIEKLELELKTAHSHAQSFETLRFELNASERQLRAAQLDLHIVRDGLAAALKATIDAPWLELLDRLKVPVQPVIDEYNTGKLSVKALQLQLHERLTDAINGDISVQLSDLEGIPLSNELQILKARIPEVTQEAELEREKPAERNVALEETLLRNEVLESKLKQAQRINEEVITLKEWQQAALEREKKLHSEVGSLKVLLQLRKTEIERQKKASLPSALMERILSDLHKTVCYLSRPEKQLELDPLVRRSPIKVSAFAGNSRLRTLRHVAKEAGTGSKLEQEIRLMQV